MKSGGGGFYYMLTRAGSVKELMAEAERRGESAETEPTEEDDGEQPLIEDKITETTRTLQILRIARASNRAVEIQYFLDAGISNYRSCIAIRFPVPHDVSPHAHLDDQLQCPFRSRSLSYFRKYRERECAHSSRDSLLSIMRWN